MDFFFFLADNDVSAAIIFSHEYISKTDIVYNSCLTCHQHFIKIAINTNFFSPTQLHQHCTFYSPKDIRIDISFFQKSFKRLPTQCFLLSIVEGQRNCLFRALLQPELTAEWAYSLQLKQLIACSGAKHGRSVQRNIKC